MRALVIGHVRTSEAPDSWRERLAASREARVTVRIEEEVAVTENTGSAFGMWCDRDDMDEVDAFVRRRRTPRFDPK